MRILIAHETAAGGGGVESYLAAIIPALRARGHEVAVLAAGARDAAGPTRLDPGADVMSAATEGIDAAFARVRAWRPDVCFSHNMRPLDIEARLTAAAPVVKMMHGYFGTCVSGLKSHAFPGVRQCDRTFGPACLPLYLPRRCGQLRPLLMIDQYAWASRQRRLFERYAHVVVASAHMAREYARHGIAPNRLTPVPLFPTVPLRERGRTVPADPAVLFLGRMTGLKGGDVLVRAVARAMRQLARPVRLIFAGTGPAESSWRRLADRLAVPAEFRGWVAGDDRPRLIDQATLLAVPSLWPEPFGLVGLEAGAHGVPSVAFDSGGIGEWLRDGISGRLVREVGSDAALGDAIAGLLADPGRLARFGEAARRVAAEFSIDAHLAGIERILRQAAVPAGTAA